MSCRVVSRIFILLLVWSGYAVFQPVAALPDCPPDSSTSRREWSAEKTNHAIRSIKAGERSILEKRFGCINEQGRTELNLRGLRLAGHRIEGVYQALLWADLSYADLRGVTFVATNLIGIELKNAKLERAAFRNLSLREAEFAHIRTSKKEQAIVIDDVKLGGVTFEDVHFPHAQLTFLNGNGIIADYATFSHAIVRDSNLRFKETNELHLDQATIRNSRLRLENSRETKLSKTVLDSVDLSASRLVRPNLKLKRAVNIDFHGVRLRRPCLSKVSFESIDWKSVVWENYELITDVNNCRARQQNVREMRKDERLEYLQVSRFYERLNAQYIEASNTEAAHGFALAHARFKQRHMPWWKQILYRVLLDVPDKHGTSKWRLLKTFGVSGIASLLVFFLIGLVRRRRKEEWARFSSRDGEEDILGKWDYGSTLYWSAPIAAAKSLLLFASKLLNIEEFLSIIGGGTLTFTGKWARFAAVVFGLWGLYLAVRALAFL